MFVKFLLKGVFFFKKNESGNNIYTNLCSPVHDVPLPVYPELQVQLNDPSVSVQNASGSQSWVFVVHSLMSGEDDAKLIHSDESISNIYYQ